MRRRKLIITWALWLPFLSALVLLTVLRPAMALLDLERLFAPKAELWERWLARDPTSTDHIDHGPWQAFLDRYLSVSDGGVNRMAYSRVSREHAQALAEDLARLTDLPISRYNAAEQRAYWINLYNALTVRVVLDHRPVESIRDIAISPGLFSPGPWGKKLAQVEGEELSLNDIEHRILRPIWKDPRIHYALNCASVGCPNLQPRAFTAANTEALLESGARDYINHTRGARVEDGALQVSSIYVWFREDFGGNDSGIIAHLKDYARPALRAELATVDTVSGHDYDWALNQ